MGRIFESDFPRKKVLFHRLFLLTHVLDKKLLSFIFVFGLTFLGNQLYLKDDANELRLTILPPKMTNWLIVSNFVSCTPTL